MGSTISTACYEDEDQPGTDLTLRESKTRFTTIEMGFLNQHFRRMIRNNENSYMSTHIEKVIESIVQRLVDEVSKADPRFKCNHLIALHRGRKIRSRSLEYLVTLDSIPALESTDECHFIESPAGYGLIKMSGKCAKKWKDFTNSNGFLCRDKLTERWVELLASCANKALFNPNANNEAVSPSPVMCPKCVLRAVPGEYCYFQKKDIKPALECRLAIVEDESWVYVRVSQLPGGGEAKLVLGVRGRGSAGKLVTVPINHPLALLYYEAAQLGWYACAVSPASWIPCNERQSLWQIRRPAAELVLESHFSDKSGPGLVALTLNAIIDHLRCESPALRNISKRVVWTILKDRLDGLRTYKDWAQVHLAHNVLCCLDRLVTISKGDEWPIRRGANKRYEIDTKILIHYIRSLYTLSSKGKEPLRSLSEILEMTLMRRWECSMKEMQQASQDRKSTILRPTYTSNQLIYIYRVIREYHKGRMSFRFPQNMFEDLIYTIAAILEQAKEIYVKTHYKMKTPKGILLEDIEKIKLKNTKKMKKHKEYFVISTSCLLDAIRNDSDIKSAELEDEEVFVSNVLDFLYRGAIDDNKYLGPVLEPFLERLYRNSLNTCWFINDYDATKYESEFEGLRNYCWRVHDAEIDPNIGLLTSARKYAWAKAMVEYADQHSDLELVFPLWNNTKLVVPVDLDPINDCNKAARTLTIRRQDKDDIKLNLAKRCVLNAFLTALEGRVDLNKMKLLNMPKSKKKQNEEFFNSMKNGKYWRSDTKSEEPNDTSSSVEQNTEMKATKRHARRERSKTTDTFPKNVSKQFDDPATLKRKFYTLRSLIYTDVSDTYRELNESLSSRDSNGNRLQTRSPSILDTFDFINGFRDTFMVGGSDVISDDNTINNKWQLTATSFCCPSNTSPHYTLTSIVAAFLTIKRYTVLQELCPSLGEAGHDALLSLRRLARSSKTRYSIRRNRSRSRNSRNTNSEDEEEAKETYTKRPVDYFSGDESPTPLRKYSSAFSVNNKNSSINVYEDFEPPSRMTLQSKQTIYDEIKPTTTDIIKLKQHTNRYFEQEYTGVIKDIDGKRNKFTNKRSKSLSRSMSNKSNEKCGFFAKNIESVKSYKLSLGRKASRNISNEMIRALNENSTETGLDYNKSKHLDTEVVGESYKLTKTAFE